MLTKYYRDNILKEYRTETGEEPITSEISWRMPSWDYSGWLEDCIENLRKYSKKHNRRNKNKIKKLQKQKKELKEKVKDLEFRISCFREDYVWE